MSTFDNLIGLLVAWIIHEMNLCSLAAHLALTYGDWMTFAAVAAAEGPLR